MIRWRRSRRRGLVVGTSNDWPYSFLDPKTREWTGLDGDIIKYIAKMLRSTRSDVQTVTFDKLTPGLLDGRFDSVGDSIHYTKNRSKVVNFCFPTYYYAEGLVVPKGNSNKLHKLTDPKGFTVGTLLGTNYAEWLQAVPGVKFQGYKDWAGARHRPHRRRAVRSARGVDADEGSSRVEDRAGRRLRAA